MNLLECCASYAADAGSIVMQHTAETQHKYTNKEVYKQN